MDKAVEITRPLQVYGISWPLLISLVWLIFVLGYLPPDRLLLDADTYWHLAAGRWMIQHGVVPSQDPFSHTMAGAPWVAHEWLTEVLFAVLYSLGGWGALVVATAAALVATLAYLMRFLLARLEPVHALLITILAASMLTTHLLARPHVFAWPFLAVWTGTLVNSVESERAPPWWLLGVILVWANLHASFSKGVAIKNGETRPSTVVLRLN